MSTCKICGATSEETKFYAGVSSRCAECHKSEVRKNRAENIEKHRAYDAKRFQSDPRVKARHKRYQATAEGKEAMLRSRTKWQEKSPEKRAAHVILGNAVRDGRVMKPKSCSKCLQSFPSRKIHAHHADYAMPLQVVWLCAQCHVDHHKGD